MQKLRSPLFISTIISAILLLALGFGIFISQNYPRRVVESKNARRASDIDTILNAIHLYMTEHHGALPPGLSSGMSTPIQIGTSKSVCAINSGACSGTPVSCLDVIGTTASPGPLSIDLVTLPIDPDVDDQKGSGYAVQVDASNTVTVFACKAQGKNISTSR